MVELCLHSPIRFYGLVLNYAEGYLYVYLSANHFSEMLSSSEGEDTTSALCVHLYTKSTKFTMVQDVPSGSGQRACMQTYVR
jgi:hypothetical protein